MNQLNPIDRDRETRFFADRLPDILGELSYAEENNCLKVIDNSTIFFIHLNEGQLVYATNSVAPFERLERHLRRLSNQNSQISKSVIKASRQKFSNELQSYISFPTDYQAILWLTEAGHITRQEAIALIRRITREVFESFLCLPDLEKYKVIPRSNKIEELCRFDLNAYIEQCRKRLQSWDIFADQIFSSYQRPYLVSAADRKIANLSTRQNETICKLLRGLNFRQISAVIDLDELAVAKILYPSMQNNTIVLRNPKPPFDLLPNLPRQKNAFELPLDPNWRGEDSGFQINSHSKQTIVALENTWKIAYVDSDRSARQSLDKYLEQSLFLTLVIDDAMKAFGELIEFEPNLIFLRTDMPNLDGYELCHLLRNHQNLRSVPIIMVSESSKKIDESKSRRAGATSSIAKPFSRTTLLTAIWHYLQ